MKWLKVIVVLVVLVAISGISIFLYSRHAIAMNEEERALFRASSTHADITSVVGRVRDAAFAFGLQRMGNAEKADKHWVRKTVGDAVEGKARLNISGAKAWARVIVDYKYDPKTGDLRVNAVEFIHAEAYPAEKN